MLVLQVSNGAYKIKTFGYVNLLALQVSNGLMTHDSFCQPVIISHRIYWHSRYYVIIWGAPAAAYQIDNLTSCRALSWNHNRFRSES